jgi:hypothetical protein
MQAGKEGGGGFVRRVLRYETAGEGHVQDGLTEDAACILHSLERLARSGRFFCNQPKRSHNRVHFGFTR